MHELGIAQAALRQVAAHVSQAGATQVHRIVLRVGELAGIDIDALRFAFEIALPASPAAGATLEIESVAAEARCISCGRDFSPSGEYLFECPHCHALGANLTRGRELDLVRLELT